MCDSSLKFSEFFENFWYVSQNAFPSCKWSFCSESNFCQIFFVLSGERAQNFRTSGEFFSALSPKFLFACPEGHSDMFFQQFSFSTPFRSLSDIYLDFWRKNFEKICPNTVYLYRRVFRGENGNCKKKFTFLFFLTSGRKKRTSVGIKNSGRLSKLTFMCTECHFEGKNLSNKTNFLMNFLGLRALNCPSL